MSKKLLNYFLLVSALSIAGKMHGQINNEPSYKDAELNYSFSQLAGYAGIGFGTAFFAYSTVDQSANPFGAVKYNSSIYYLAGSALIITGACLLIWGNKKKKNHPNYWKGMSKSDNTNNKFPSEQSLLHQCPETETLNDKDVVVIQYYVFGKLFQPVSYFKKSPTPSLPIGKGEGNTSPPQWGGHRRG